MESNIIAADTSDVPDEVSSSIVGQLKPRARSWVTVYGLLAVFFSLAPWWQGVDLFDNTSYIRIGIDGTPASFIHDFANSPLYGAWFRLLHFFIRDCLWLYMFSWALMVVLLCCIPLWRKLPYAWLYALILLCAPLFCIVPYIGLFAAVFLTSGMVWVLQRTPSLSTALFCACCLCFVLSYARPEFGYGVYISTAVLFVWLLFDSTRGTPRSVVIKLALSILFAASIHYSISHSPTQRSGLAFAQHTNLRAFQNGLIHENPFSSPYTQQKYNVDPTTDSSRVNASVADFFRANPAMFLRDVFANLRDPRSLGLILSTLLLVSLPWLVNRLRELRAASLYIALVSTPVLAATIIIYPRAHYATAIVPSMLLLALQMLAAFRITPTPPAWLILPLGLAIMLPEARAYRHGHMPDLTVSIHATLGTVECMRSYESAHGVGNGLVLSQGWPFYDRIYLHAPVTFTDAEGAKSVPALLIWVRDKQPAWIIVTPYFADYYGVPDQKIGQDLQNAGYIPHPCLEEPYDGILYTKDK
jgi:hypothetical protein